MISEDVENNNDNQNNNEENEDPNQTRRVAPARTGYRGFNAWGASQLVRIGPDLSNQEISLTENISTLPVIDDDDNDRALFNGILSYNINLIQ